MMHYVREGQNWLACPPDHLFDVHILCRSTRSRTPQGAPSTGHFQFASSHTHPIFHQTSSKSIASSAPSPVFPWKWPSPQLSFVPNTTPSTSTPGSTTVAEDISVTVTPSPSPAPPSTGTPCLDKAGKVATVPTVLKTNAVEQHQEETPQQDDHQRDQRRRRILQDREGSTQTPMSQTSVHTPAPAATPTSQHAPPRPAHQPGLQSVTPGLQKAPLASAQVTGLQQSSSRAVLQFPVGAEDSDESLDLDPDFGVAGAPLSAHSWNGGPPDGSCLHSCDAWEADSDDTSPFGDADDGFCCGVESDMQDGFPGLQVCGHCSGTYIRKMMLDTVNVLVAESSHNCGYIVFVSRLCALA